MSGPAGVRYGALMSLLGVLTFLALAAVSVDVLGGILAATFLHRGIPPRHLLLFVGGYAAVVTAATLVIQPLLEILGGWLQPILASNNALGIVEIVVGVALIVVAWFQRRTALRPKPRTLRREVSDRTVSLLLGGAAFAVTAIADPAFVIAIGLAGAEPHMPLRIALLVLWNLVYQAPLVAVTAAALLGRHEALLTKARALITPRRRFLFLLLAGALLLLGLIIAADGVIALLTAQAPWLRELLLLR